MQTLNCHSRLVKFCLAGTGYRPKGNITNVTGAPLVIVAKERNSCLTAFMKSVTDYKSFFTLWITSMLLC